MVRDTLRGATITAPNLRDGWHVKFLEIARPAPSADFHRWPSDDKCTVKSKTYPTERGAQCAATRWMNRTDG